MCRSPNATPCFGAHESVAGGLHTAFERIRKVDGHALQIFTRNQRQWESPPLGADEIQAFLEGWERWGDYPVAGHASYLLNPASPDDALRRRSAHALAMELDRCRALHIGWVALHPGAAMGTTPDQALTRVARTLDAALAQSGGDGPVILLENTAGQGSCLGSTVQELTEIMARSARPERLGVCLDTCHAFAAGLDVRSKEGLDALLGELPPGKLTLVHVNDSKGGLGSRLDRHEHIGKGGIGLEGFGTIVNHPALASLPMILETPKEKDLLLDVENLKTLRGLVT